MKWIIGKLILRPLVVRNYRLRCEGVLPDEWYWADKLLMKWKLWDLIPKTSTDIQDGWAS